MGSIGPCSLASRIVYSRARIALSEPSTGTSSLCIVADSCACLLRGFAHLFSLSFANNLSDFQLVECLKIETPAPCPAMRGSLMRALGRDQARAWSSRSLREVEQGGGSCRRLVIQLPMERLLG